MKRNVFVADFETSFENGTAWVYAFGIAKLYDDYIKFGSSLDEFMRYVFKSTDKIVYFHNLKFDGRFILYWLLKNGYEYVEKITAERQYTHLIDTMNNFYSIQVSYTYKEKIRKVEFLDSYKKLPFSLAKIAKDFNIEETKLVYDYGKIRYEGHTLTREEKQYLANDVIILRKAIEITEAQGMQKMTIGSNALAFYKNTVNKSDAINFKSIFPHLEDSIDEYLRNAYRGGCSIVNKKKVGKVLTVYSYDVNSMYPAQLRYKPMPWGYPQYFKGKYEPDEKYPLYIQHIKCEFFIKPQHIPCIQIKKSIMFDNNEWIENSTMKVDLYLTNLDLEIFLESYHTVGLEYIDGYKFHSMRGLFTEYIEHWYNIKKTSDNPSLVTIAKLHLNSLYGKFGTAPKKSRLTFQLEDDTIRRKDVIVDKVRTVYLPIAIFVTSYARHYLIKSINANYDDFIYCDTDSIHLERPAKHIEVDAKKLGAFKFEYKGKGKYLKQKCYLVRYDEEYIKNGKAAKLVCAGLNQSFIEESDFEFDNFYVGRRYKKLKQKNVHGGVYLKEEEHIIT